MLIILLYKLFLNFLRLEVIEFMFLFILGFFGEFFSLMFEFFDFDILLILFLFILLV